MLVVDAVLACAPQDVPVRVAVDGPACAAPDDVSAAMAAVVRGLGREPIVIRTQDFWRDASLRLEFGRQDVDAYFEGWLDRSALEREVLRPLGPDGDRRYLPALRDARSNRSARAPYRSAAPGS